MYKITISASSLKISELKIVLQEPIEVTLSKDIEEGIKKSAGVVSDVINSGKVVYGINTGFGHLANKRIETDDLALLQKSLVLSHAAGVGEPIEDGLTRLIMLLKIKGLSRGYSGVRLELVRCLADMLNAGVYPVIPRKGSVGASGDLAPLAHMTLVLMGEGFAHYKGQTLSGKEALKAAGLSPIELGPKEGLALLNGTQVSTSFALKGLFLAEDLFAAAIACGCLTIEGVSAARTIFDERIHQVRGQQGQIDAAAAYRRLLGPRSEIGDDHINCDRVQDPYCLRCQPQVMGACLTQIRNAAAVLEIEANAASDNPLVFTDNGDVISGGNFHAEPVAMAADNLALAFAEIGAISERRIATLVDPHMSRLPPFLVENAGVNSGFMIAHVTAAALASQNKTLSFPSCVDSLPTSANQEDQVSMAPNAGRRLWEMAENVKYILAIEYLAAVQGIEFKKGLKTTPALEKYHEALRKVVPNYDKDRFFAPDIETAANLIDKGIFADAVEGDLLPSWKQ
ncbi:histidine ammonia-lyase [Treponema primitia]|uniref:histidine ammonia-lyase n=1 Tax=Treponema primitia TaxID=88058 RepID=UPI0002554FA2|nr:histidine ammonia-lyase [Treponema primitia]